MLCPTAAMKDIFTIVPTFLMWPSYRTFTTFLVYLVGPTVSVVYMTAAKGLLVVKRVADGKAMTQGNAQRKKVHEYTTKGGSAGATGSLNKSPGAAKGGTKKDK